MYSVKTILTLSLFVPFADLSSQQHTQLHVGMRVPTALSERQDATGSPLDPWRSASRLDPRLITSADGWKAYPRFQDNARRRSPFLAGTLSFVGGFVLVHGIGSFYAGNTGHGLRHLGIGIGTMGVAVGAAVACLYCDGDEPLVYVVFAAFSAYVANYVWSVVTAVGDAKAFNRSHARPSAFGLEPTIVVMRAHATSSYTVSRNGRVGLGFSARF